MFAHFVDLTAISSDIVTFPCLSVHKIDFSITDLLMESVFRGGKCVSVEQLTSAFRIVVFP